MSRRAALIALAYRILIPIFLAGYLILRRINRDAQYSREDRILAALPLLAKGLKPAFSYHDLDWKPAPDANYQVDIGSTDQTDRETRFYQLSASIPASGTDLCLIQFELTITDGTVQVQVLGQKGELLCSKNLDKVSDREGQLAFRVGHNDSLQVVLTDSVAVAGRPAFQIHQFDVYCVKSGDIRL